MPTREEYTKQPLEWRLERLERTADDLAAPMRGRSDADLLRRPDAKNWSATEIVCQTMLAMDEPKVLSVGAMPTNPAEWAGMTTTTWPNSSARSRAVPEPCSKSRSVCGHI